MNGDPREIARRIAKGHARTKHWPGLTEEQLARKIEDIFENFRRCFPPGTGHSRKFYEGHDGTIVIVDDSIADNGTVFIPDRRNYFDDLVDSW